MAGDEIRFWNGSKIYLCHCKDEKDRYKYLAAEIHLLLIDELTTFSDTIYRFLHVAAGWVGIKMPDELKGMASRIICARIPATWGINGSRSMFIDPREPLECEIMPEAEGGMLRQYIPARLEDNPSMSGGRSRMTRAKVSGMGNPELGSAMRDGDWNVVAGAFFSEFNADRHIIPPRALPEHWTRLRSFDQFGPPVRRPPGDGLGRACCRTSRAQLPRLLPRGTG